MSKLEKILVVVDRRMRRTGALDRGVALARRSGAQLHLCLFDHDPLILKTAELVSPAVSHLAKEQFLAQRRAWLQTLAATWAEQGLRVECSVVWAPLLDEAILDRILQLGPDLVLKDVQHDPMRQHTGHTPADLRLLRHAPAPIMMVRSTARYLPRRIAAAVDLDPTSPSARALNHAVVEAALALGRDCEAEVHLLRVEVPYIAPNPESLPLYEAYADLLQADREAFHHICAGHEVDLTRRHLLEGEPVTELTRFAQRMDIDVMVLGATYRSDIDRFLLGSTTEGVLADVDCDVLLVKAADFRALLGQHLDLRSLHQRQLAAA